MFIDNEHIKQIEGEPSPVPVHVVRAHSLGGLAKASANVVAADKQAISVRFSGGQRGVTVGWSLWH